MPNTLNVFINRGSDGKQHISSIRLPTGKVLVFNKDIGSIDLKLCRDYIGCPLNIFVMKPEQDYHLEESTVLKDVKLEEVPYICY